MNLTTDPWVPVLRADGRSELLSLRQLFAQAHEMRDLVAKPHERIALMRLLVCITQAALDGPADEDAWAECRDEIQSRVAAYLEKWAAAFELFGDGPRFLQFRPGMIGEPSPCMENEAVTRLDLTLASGESTPTLFDNAAAGSTRALAPHSAALNLLTYQCYSPLLGRGYKGRAPCADASALHSLLLGKDLLESIRANLLSHEIIRDCYGAEKIGKPVWELSILPVTDASRTLITSSYLGRLVPVSRSVWLDSLETMTLANGFVYEGFDKVGFREATTTLVRKGTDQLRVLRCNVERAVWREFPAIFLVARGHSSEHANAGGPLALRLSRIDENLSLWCGGMNFPKEQAKIEDSIESKYALCVDLFDPFKRAAYESGVNHAETGETSLRRAVGSYASSLKVDQPAYDAARRHFWTRVEQSLEHLFAVARELTPPDQLAASPWSRAVRAAAIEAFERTCPRRTPRQIQAFALGQRHLFAPPRTGSASASKTKSRKQHSS